MSRLALGSWRTFERMPREDGLAVMRAAREHGLNFFPSIVRRVLEL